jgi:hypothetical protein
MRLAAYGFSESPIRRNLTIHRASLGAADGSYTRHAVGLEFLATRSFGRYSVQQVRRQLHSLEEAAERKLVGVKLAQ